MSWKTDKIALLKDRLSKIEKAIDEVIENGVSYSLNGSHSVTLADLGTLREMESATMNRILSLSGVKVCRRTVAKFDGGRMKEC